MSSRDILLLLVGLVIVLFLVCIGLLMTWILRGGAYRSAGGQRSQVTVDEPEPVVVQFDADIEAFLRPQRRGRHRAEEAS